MPLPPHLGPERSRAILQGRTKWVNGTVLHYAFFGAKPEVILKGGFIAWSAMGDANASLMTCQPVLYRPQYGAYGANMRATCHIFVTVGN